MAYTFPHYLTSQGDPAPELLYVWDDTRTDLDFEYDADELIDKMWDATTRAKIEVGSHVVPDIEQLRSRVALTCKVMGKCISHISDHLVGLALEAFS